MRRKIIVIDGWPYRVQVQADPEDGGYVSSCVDMPGCMSQGETISEAYKNIKLAIVDIVNASQSQRLSA
jgi:predicted RNase H-like HicB family nuclease